jgi:hypothetical protein
MLPNPGDNSPVEMYIVQVDGRPTGATFKDEFEAVHAAMKHKPGSARVVRVAA